MSLSLRTVAVVLMVVGAMALISPQLASTSVMADRTTTVDVAADSSNAVLGIDARSDIGELRGNDGAVQIGNLTNSLGESADLKVWIVDIPGESDSLLTAHPDDVDLSDGETESATVECAGSTKADDTDVVFGANATGSKTTVTNATFTVTIDIQCQKGGGGNGGGTCPGNSCDNGNKGKN
jgi:hypothetical protein